MRDDVYTLKSQLILNNTKKGTTTLKGEVN